MPELSDEDLKRIRRLYKSVEKTTSNARFERISRLLESVGFQCKRTSGGSHNVFRRKGTEPISVPKAIPVNQTYVVEVLKIVMELCNERFGLGWTNDGE